MTIERRDVLYFGRVQGVGFRYTARQIASRWAVTGYVENLPDGRVRLVAEGTAADLDAFLGRLGETMTNLIADQSVTASAATGEFDGFVVRY